MVGQLLAAAVAGRSSTVPKECGNMFNVGGFIPPETVDRQHVRTSDYNMSEAKRHPRFRFCRETTFPAAISFQTRIAWIPREHHQP